MNIDVDTTATAAVPRGETALAAAGEVPRAGHLRRATATHTVTTRTTAATRACLIPLELVERDGLDVDRAARALQVPACELHAKRRERARRGAPVA